MSNSAPASPTEGQAPIAHGPFAVAQGMAGDAASTDALNRLSRKLAGRAGSAKAQRRMVELLKSAVAAVRVQDYGRGAERCLEVLRIDEKSGLAWHVLAICQEKSGHLAQALSAYEAALSLMPEENNIAHDLSRLAQRLGQLEIAEKLLRKFLAVEPGHVDATNNLACVLRDANRYAEAVDVLRDMIQVEPESALLWNTLGTVQSDQGDMSTALTFFEEALRLDPDFSKARYNRANVRQPLGDLEGALEDIEAALPGAEPGYETAMMTMARALLRLGAGDLEGGWADYEIRLSPDMPEAMHAVVDMPRWDPATQPLKGMKLLVIGEQGIADEMVFGSTLGDLIEAVGPEGQVIVAVEARLVDLFQRTFPKAIVGGHKAVKMEGRLYRYIPFMEGEDAPEGDAWVPMASLMPVFRPTVAAFPDRTGYLTADPARVAHWKAEVEALGPGLKVGLHWKSLVLTGVRARYFSSFERWKPVLTTPGCVMVNLQCGDVSEDLAAAEAAGVRLWTPPIDLKNDLEDLAALSLAMDVVIGPGIAGTNIAAAVGAETWLIYAPDDWHLLGTDRYPFYPRMRTFARAFDGWDAAIADVATALAERASG